MVHEHPEYAKLLLETGKIDLDYCEEILERSTMLRALTYEHAGLHQTLLECGNLNLNLHDKQGKTPLCWAAFYGDARLMKILLNIPHVDVHLADAEGKTPLYWTAFCEETEIASMLLNSGKINLSHEDNGF